MLSSSRVQTTETEDAVLNNNVFLLEAVLS